MTVDVRIPHAGQGSHTLLVAIELDDLALEGRDLAALSADIAARCRSLSVEAIRRHRARRQEQIAEALDATRASWADGRLPA